MSKKSQDVYHRRESGFSSGFFWGIALGAAGVFLFGTKKGKKLKKFINEHGEQLIEEFDEISQSSDPGKAIVKRLKKPSAKLKNIQKKLPKQIKKTVKKISKNKQVETLTKDIKDISHISKLQERGRKAANKFFTRGGKSLK